MKTCFRVTAAALIIGTALFTKSALAVVTTEESVAALKDQVNGINEQILELKPVLDGLAKIKLSGYIQSQFQLAENDGISSMSGGSFPAGNHQRFSIRRGRLKVNYVNNSTQYVLQMDVTQGGVGIKDAYMSYTFPWDKKDWTLTTGAFDRPFGFEISYSSSTRESPERSRMYQVLFPGERDLGMKIEYAPESGPLSFLRGKVGVFNGMGVTAVENDNNKDIIGRLGVTLPFYAQNMALDAGVSTYMGKVRNADKYLYTVEGAANKWTVDSTDVNKNTYFDRTYMGFDAQYYADLPVIGGLSFRTEFISGDQPSLKGSNTFYNPSGLTGEATALYQRQFSGYYVNYIQNVGLMDQFVLKYDSFDPNTEVAGDDIGATGNNSGTADIQYNTLGLGWVHHMDGNVKLVVYYDMPANEKVNSAVTSASLLPFKEDVKDNVLTVRMQYKF